MCRIDKGGSGGACTGDLHHGFTVGGGDEVRYPGRFFVEAARWQGRQLAGVVFLAPADIPGSGDHRVGAVIRVAVGLDDAALRKLDPVDEWPRLSAGWTTRRPEPLS